MVDIVASGDGRQALACLAPLASFALLMRRELGSAPHLPALSPGSRASLTGACTDQFALELRQAG